MKIMNFTTNINCGGCVSSLTPTLNELLGEDNWLVDTSNPSKILTVFYENLSAKDIIKALKDSGYEIKPITNN